MMARKREVEAVYAAAVLVLVLLVQFLPHLLPGHYLYQAMIEDPGARYNLISHRRIITVDTGCTENPIPLDLAKN